MTKTFIGGFGVGYVTRQLNKLPCFENFVDSPALSFSMEIIVSSSVAKIVVVVFRYFFFFEKATMVVMATSNGSNCVNAFVLLPLHVITESMYFCDKRACMLQTHIAHFYLFQ